MKTDKKEFSDLYSAWSFLYDHSIFDLDGGSVFHICFSICVIKVNPKTKRVDRIKQKNIETLIFLECGPYCKPENLRVDERKDFPNGVPSNDVSLLTKCTTFEEGVIILANKVKFKYGDGILNET